MTKIKSHLTINQLKLNVNLGWRLKERQDEQAILLDIDIIFPHPPASCKTDQLEDTVCYATLINHLRHELGEKHYRLVEHLTDDIYHILKTQLKIASKIKICLTKFPEIKGLTGGICFYFGDA